MWPLYLTCPQLHFIWIQCMVKSVHGETAGLSIINTFSWVISNTGHEDIMHGSLWHFWPVRWSKYTVQHCSSWSSTLPSHPPLWKHSSNILTENTCCPINFVWKLDWLTATIPATDRNCWAYFNAQSLLQYHLQLPKAPHSDATRLILFPQFALAS